MIRLLPVPGLQTLAEYDVGRGTGPAFEKVSPDQINPGDKIEMFEQWWNVRYINFYAGSRWFQLQREEDELHPLCDKTCMKVEFHDGLHVRIKRMLPARGGRDA